MKAFLSHSSRDKGFVNSVAELVGGANVHLDSDTFSFGSLNSHAILEALKSCDLFVLFVSSRSNESPIVRWESRIAEELLAKGVIDRLLFVCIDPKSFDDADAEWKKYNFVRRDASPKSVARLIQSTLMGIRARKSSTDQPFVGRASELDAAKERLIDPSIAPPAAIYVSGNTGIGRRTFAKHLYRDVYPGVNSVIPEIAIDKYDSYDEIYRKIRAQIAPESTLKALTELVALFDAMDDDGKADTISSVVGSVRDGREAIILRDHGGLLQESGALQPAIQSVIEKVSAYPHPPLILVADRTPPQSERSKNTLIVYCPLNSLSEGAVRQLIALRLRQKETSYTENDLENLVELSDRHPFNVNYIMECVDTYTLPVFLANPSDLTTWKHRRTADFIESLPTPKDESLVLAILKNFPALDFSVLVDATDLNTDQVGNAVASLMDKHIVETGAGTYFISPPLKGAVDRSPRFKLSTAALQKAMTAIGNMLVSVDEDSPLPVSMIESSILAMLHSDTPLPEHVSAFLLPSHLIWLARRRYDERLFRDSIKFSKEALKSKDRLSLPGKVEACRLLCLSSARLDQVEDFEAGMSTLQSLPKDGWVQSMIDFLKGFEARLGGRLPEAESFQREAFRNRPGNFHSARELAFICLTRGNLADAEFYARQAFHKAPDNPYILDILLSVLIRLSTNNKNVILEIEDLLVRLDRSGHEDGKSFYETRKAEYEFVSGNTADAAKLIDLASQKTPNIFDIRALRARIYLALNNKPIVAHEIEQMNKLVQRKSNEGRTNLRPLIEVKAEYYVACRDFKAAKKAYDVPGIFDDDEKRRALKSIDVAEAYYTR